MEHVHSRKRKTEQKLDSEQPPLKQIKYSTLYSLQEKYDEKFIEAYSTSHNYSNANAILHNKLIKGVVLYENGDQQQLKSSISCDSFWYPDQITNTVITFDNKNVVKVECTCKHMDMLWCSHVIATFLVLLKEPESIIVYNDLKETISKLDKNQLQVLLLNRIFSNCKVAGELREEIEKSKFDELATMELNTKNYSNTLELDTKPFVERIDAAIQQINDREYDDDDCYSIDCDCDGDGYFIIMDAALKETFTAVKKLWEQKDINNALKIMTSITEAMIKNLRQIEEDDLQQRCLDILAKEWMKYCAKESFPEDMKEIFVIQMKEWGKVTKDAFLSVVEVLQNSWTSSGLKQILSGEDFENISWKEKIRTIIARLEYLRAQSKKKEAYNFACWATFQFRTINNSQQLLELANAVEEDYPAGAIILMTKVFWLRIHKKNDQNGDYGLFNLYSTIVKMLELASKFKHADASKESKIPTLQKLTAIQTAKSLVQFYEDNWDECTKILSNIPERLLAMVAIHLTALLCNKYDSASDSPQYYYENILYGKAKKYHPLFLEKGEKEAAFEAGLGYLREPKKRSDTSTYWLKQNSDAILDIDLMQIAISMGRAYVQKLVEKVFSLSKHVLGDRLFEYAEELKNTPYCDLMLDLLIKSFSLIWDDTYKQQDAIKLLVQTSEQLGETMIRGVLETMFSQSIDPVIIVDVLKMIQSKNKSVAKYYSLKCWELVRSNKISKTSISSIFTCKCSACKSIIEFLRDRTRSIVICFPSDQREKLQHIIKECEEAQKKGFDVNTYMSIGPSIELIVSKNLTSDQSKMFRNSGSEHQHLFIELPKMLLQLYSENGKLDPKIAESLKEAFTEAEDLVSFAMTLKDYDIKEAMKLALHAVSLPGPTNRSQVANVFCKLAQEQGDKEYELKLAISVAKHEPSETNFNRVKSLVSPEKYNTIKQQLIPSTAVETLSNEAIELLLKEQKFDLLKQCIKKQTEQKLQWCMKIVTYCMDLGISSDICTKMFWDETISCLKDAYLRSEFSSYLPNYTKEMDSWSELLINSTKPGYGTLGLSVFKIRTETLANTVTSHKSSSYEYFVLWMRKLKSYFEKFGITKQEWSKYLNQIIQTPNVWRKRKLVEMLQKDTEINQLYKTQPSTTNLNTTPH